jgi:hypothetical protein
VTIRLIRPDVQCQRIIALFQGARVPHPAAALAAWKRAKTPHRQLGKPLEAAIAALNPEMAAELRLLDQAEMKLAFDPVPDPGGNGRHWYATIPRDDGTFAALATALVLTGGGNDPPLGGVAVDRLGLAGALLMARAGTRLTLASSRSALAAALAEAMTPNDQAVEPAGAEDLDSGWIIRVEPAGLGQSGPITRIRLAEGLRALGCRQVDAVAALQGDALRLSLKLRLDRPPLPRPCPAAPIDPAWLDELPALEAQPLLLFAWAIDPSPASWDRLFNVSDRIERADPARAGVAPLRTRINLLATAVKARPEVDLWPRLRGLSGVLVAAPPGPGRIGIGGAVINLHTESPEAAARIAGQVLPRLAPLAGLRPEPELDAGANGPSVRRLGRLRGRPVFLAQRGATVQVGWGDCALAPLTAPRGNPGPAFNSGLQARASWGNSPPHRFVAFWPDGLDLAANLGEPLALTLAGSPPALWSGRDEPSGASDEIRWDGLRDLVHRFLDRLPMDLEGP